jgi:hypothetical protein
MPLFEANSSYEFVTSKWIAARRRMLHYLDELFLHFHVVAFELRQWVLERHFEQTELSHANPPARIICQKRERNRSGLV